MRRLVVASFVSVVAALGATGSAQALTWAPQSVPDPTEPNGALNGISCLSSSSCTAVGDYNVQALPGGEVPGFAPLAARWNGASWSIMNPPSPPGADQTYLWGVSCPSSTFCAAVGGWTGVNAPLGAPPTGLLEVWNGATWSIVQAAGEQLLAVSCASSRSCVAVGGDESMIWNGTAWTSVGLAVPTGADQTNIGAVSCLSSTDCTAAGDQSATAGATTSPLAERWNGTAWAVQATPSPVGRTLDALHAVSCPSVNACVAVGSAGNPSSGASPQTYSTLAEVWNGSRWTIRATPRQLHSAGSVAFDAVSCTSAVYCLAGGDGKLVELWNGTAWTVESRPAGTFTPVEGVACVTGDVCTLVGATFGGLAGPQAFVELWNAGVLSAEPAPNEQQPVPGELASVACTAPGSCEAVGTNQAGLTAYSEVGGNWTEQAVAQPSAQGDELSGIACATATRCTAVGSRPASTLGEYVPLVEVLRGTSWTVRAVPAPPRPGQLNAISCASAISCVAVGYQYQATSAATEPLAEIWNGVRWSIASQPPATGPESSELLAIDCTSSSSCVAVGDSQTSAIPPDDYQTLVEAWNGSSWSVEPSPNASGEVDSHLEGVSCTSSTSCVAVGSADNDTLTMFDVDTEPLAESWDGTSWTIQPTPGPTGGAGGALAGVSCTSTVSCTAVGASEARPPLAETWDGSAWTLDIVSAPANGSFSSVSCLGAANCVGVGGGGTTSQPLAETGT